MWISVDKKIVEKCLFKTLRVFHFFLHINFLGFSRLFWAFQHKNSPNTITAKILNSFFLIRENIF